MRKFGRTGLEGFRSRIRFLGHRRPRLRRRREGAVAATRWRVPKSSAAILSTPPQVYGDAEVTLGEFLEGRRSRWIVATKFSGQKAGMTATLERQLTRLRHRRRGSLPAALGAARRRRGAVRRARAAQARRQDTLHRRVAVLGRGHRLSCSGCRRSTHFSSPSTCSSRIHSWRALAAIHAGGKARDRALGAARRIPHRQVQARCEISRPQRPAARADARQQIATDSSTRSNAFASSRRRRARWWTRRHVIRCSFADVSTVILGTKSSKQADSNFGQVPGGTLSAESLQAIRNLQVELGLGSRAARWLRKLGLVP